MMHRFKHYQRNMGTRDTIINLVVVAYLGFVFFGNGFDPIGFVLAGVMLAAAFLPLLFLNFILDHLSTSLRAMRYFQFVVLIVFALQFAGVWSPPWFLWLSLIPLIGLSLGAGFWIFSDPRILTPQGQSYYTAYAYESIHTEN